MADSESTNWKCGIDVVFGVGDGSDKGTAYAEEYFFHNTLIDDHKVVYLKSDTLIHMSHNERNVAFDAPLNPNGTQAAGRMVSVGTDVGTIRYKIDRDQQRRYKWANNSAGTEAFVLPAYTAPFTLAELEYEPGVSVIGSTGVNGGVKGSVTGRYFRGCVDSVGDEWHVLSYADDDRAYQMAKPYNIDQAWFASDGKTVLLVVNPKTPCLTVRTTGNGQFYTTKPKAYFTPKIHDQTTYFNAGTGTVTFELRDINGNNVFYRIVFDPSDAVTPYTNTGASSVTLSGASFATGKSYLQYYYAGNSAYTKTRTVVKNPAHPSLSEPHGHFLWSNFSVIQGRIARAPYYSRYNAFKTRSDTSGQDIWDANAGQGKRFIGATSSLTANNMSLVSAFVAKAEGATYTRSGASKSFLQYAKEMLLDHPRTIDPLGFELAHTSDAIPSRETQYRGYYDAWPALCAAFAYDILVAEFRSDQVSGGITAIEDYFVRDMIAGFAFEGMQWASGVSGTGEPGMWGGARMMTAVSIAMILSEYSTPYYGTSGFGSVQTTYPWCPFEDDQLTWKKALFDLNAPKTSFPNYRWGLGLSDNDPDSIFLFENQQFGGLTWPFATWRNKLSYMSTGLMGRHLMIWANMVKRHGGGVTDLRLETGFTRASLGTFDGATPTDGVYPPPERHALLLLLNDQWPAITNQNMEWVQGNGVNDANGVSRQLQDTEVFGFAWYDDAALVGTVATPASTPEAGYSEAVTEITLYCPTPGATIHFTTNGDTPTTSSPVYSAPFELGASATVKAMAVKTGSNNSAIMSVTYVVNTSGKPVPVTGLRLV